MFPLPESRLLPGAMVAAAAVIAVLAVGAPRPVRAQAAAPLSLKDVSVPLPPNLHAFLRGNPSDRSDAAAVAAARQTAIVLGKALFWDMQLGSDNVQACASCHFNAGADN